MHNRTYLKKILLLIFLFTLTGISSAQQRENYKFLITSDIHTSFQLNQYNPVFYEMRRHTVGNADSLIRFYRTIPQKTDADAVVITGDLIDYYEAGLSGDSSALIANQIEQFNALSAFCPVPLYLTLGNHDITSYWINKADSSRMTTQVYADRARASWIRNVSVFKNGTYYAELIKVENTTYHFVFLDNGYSLRDGGRMIDKTQLDWLQNQMDKAGNDPVLLFFHIYFPVGDINGDSLCFRKDKALNWPGEKDCSSGLLKVLNEHKNIKAMFVGHQHNNVWEGINFPAGHKIYQVMTSTLDRSRNNWRMIELLKDTVIISKPGSNEKEIEIKF